MRRGQRRCWALQLHVHAHSLAYQIKHVLKARHAVFSRRVVSDDELAVRAHKNVELREIDAVLHGDAKCFERVFGRQRARAAMTHQEWSGAHRSEAATASSRGVLVVITSTPAARAPASR